jgi:hypothetical protein
MNEYIAGMVGDSVIAGLFAVFMWTSYKVNQALAAQISEVFKTALETMAKCCDDEKENLT